MSHVRTRSLRRLSCCLVGAFALIACGDSSSGSERDGTVDEAPLLEQRSMLIVTFDTTRADFIDSYGAELGVTPNLDALAARGVLYEDAYAPMPQTLPSHATLFTGLPPRQHRALENTYALHERYATLAEVASERGYQTAAFVGASVLEPRTGIAQGFDVFDLPRHKGSAKWQQDKLGHPPQRTAKQVTEAALDWLAQRDDSRPFLLWVHYYDPHGDAQPAKGARHVGFVPPQRHLDAVDRAVVTAHLEALEDHWVDASLNKKQMIEFWHAYAAELRFTDEQFGRLHAALVERGLERQTVVVVAGDHGEGLYEHDVKGHGVAVWEESHRIPLVIATPGDELAGTRVAGAAFLRDVRPTLERLVFDAEPAPRSDDLGLDLWTAAAAARALSPRPVFLERPHFPEQRARLRGIPFGFLTAVTLDGLKLIRFPDGHEELYDLVADPAEQHDLRPSDPERAERLAGLLDEWIRRNPASEPGAEVREVDCESLKMLVALGYAAAEELDGCDD